MILFRHQKRKRNQSGFALLMALFVMLGVTAVISASLLNMSRHGRDTQRTGDKIRANWAAEAVLEIGIDRIQNYISTHNRFPIQVVENSNPIVLSDIQSAVQSVFENDSLLSKMSLLDLQITQTSVPSDIYSATFTVAVHVKDTETMAESKKSQVFTSALGDIFDFGIFYNDDLEMAPGVDSEFQGPIFSNGNIFLMTGVNHSLTLKAPDLIGRGNAAASIPSNLDYIIKTAGNVYFYFKPMMARNYMFDHNPQYRAGAPQRLLPGNHNFGHAETFNLTWYDDVARPMVYFLKNDILNREEWGVIGHGHGHKGLNVPSDHRVFFKDRCQGVDCTSLGTELTFDSFGYWAIAWEMAEPQDVTAVFPASSYSQDLNISPAYSEDTFRQAAGLLETKDTASFDPAVNPKWEAAKQKVGRDLIQDKNDGVSHVNIPIGNLPLDQSPHILIEPIKNADDVSVRAVKFQTQADLKIICGNSSCTDFSILGSNGVQLTGVADIKDALRVSVFADKRLGGVATSSRHVVAGATEYSVTQHRHSNNRFKALKIDFAQLLPALTLANPAKSVSDASHPWIIYVETKPFSQVPATVTESQQTTSLIESQPFRMVVIDNAQKIPVGGLTIATNGRMWVRGDFNIIEKNGSGNCKTDRVTKWPQQCDVPSAALISDSMGILSSDAALDENLTQLTQSGPTTEIDVSKVTDDVMVNSAVVTGYMKSTLTPKYPNCNEAQGVNIKNCINAYWAWGLADGSHMPGHDGGYQSQVWSGDIQTQFSCSDGYQSDGQPRFPSKCAYFNDPIKGIYYFRRVFFLRSLLDYIKKEQTNYADMMSRFPEFQTYQLPVHSGSLVAAYSAVINLETAYPGSDLSANFNADAQVVKDEIKKVYAPDSEFLAAMPIISKFKGADHLLVYLANENQQTKTIGGLPVFKPILKDNALQYQWVRYDMSEADRAQFLANRTDGLAPYIREVRTGVQGIPLWPIPINSDYSLTNYQTGERIKKLAGTSDSNSQHPSAQGLWGPTPVPLVAGVTFVIARPWSILGGTPQSFGSGQLRTCTYEQVPGGEAGKIEQKITCTTDAADAFYIHANDSPRDLNTLNPAYHDLMYTSVYVHGRLKAMYDSWYSGGVENLINFQQAWDDGTTSKSLFFSGTLTAPWSAEELLKPVIASGGVPKPAYFRTDYYSAPKRIYDFNERLSESPPPGTPQLYSFQRVSHKDEPLAA